MSKVIAMLIPTTVEVDVALSLNWGCNNLDIILAKMFTLPTTFIDLFIGGGELRPPPST